MKSSVQGENPGPPTPENQMVGPLLPNFFLPLFSAKHRNCNLEFGLVCYEMD